MTDVFIMYMGVLFTDSVIPFALGCVLCCL